MQFQIVDREDKSKFLTALKSFCKKNAQNNLLGKSNFSIFFFKDIFVLFGNKKDQENFNEWKELSNREELTKGTCNLYLNTDKTQLVIKVTLDRNNFFFLKNKKRYQELLKECKSPTIKIELIDTLKKEFIPKKKKIEPFSNKRFLNNINEDYKNVLDGNLDTIRFFNNIEEWVNNHLFNDKDAFIEKVKKVSETAKIFTTLDKDVNTIRLDLEALRHSRTPLVHSRTINRLTYIRRKHTKISDYLHHNINFTRSVLFLKKKLIDLDELNLLLKEMENRWMMVKA